MRFRVKGFEPIARSASSRRVSPPRQSGTGGHHSRRGCTVRSRRCAVRSPAGACLFGDCRYAPTYARNLISEDVFTDACPCQRNRLHEWFTMTSMIQLCSTLGPGVASRWQIPSSSAFLSSLELSDTQSLMNLKYGPASEPLHISVKHLFSN